MFGLWSTRSRSAIGSYPTKDAALQAVRDLLARGYAPSALFLGHVDTSAAIASGTKPAAAAGIKAAVAG